MAEEFFQVLAECLEREGRRKGRPGIAPEVLKEFFTDSRPETEELRSQPRRKAAPPSMPPHSLIQASPALETSASSSSSVPISASATGNGGDVALPDSLDMLAETVAQCRRCILAETRQHVVFGEGNPHAGLMFIGEGPGADEDRLGRPFVGRAGQLLDKMIAAMQFTREEVYIANIVKCRPPGNRVPSPDEAACCIGYLKKQIELIRPEAIVLLGATAVTFLLGPVGGITRVRGRWFAYEGIPVMPTFHPAYLLRQESAKREAWIDLQMVMKVFGKTPPSRKRA